MSRSFSFVHALYICIHMGEYGGIARARAPNSLLCNVQCMFFFGYFGLRYKGVGLGDVGGENRNNLIGVDSRA